MDYRTRNAIEKHGSLSDVHPELLQEWDYERNTVLPSETSSGTDYLAWWNCAKCKNIYQMRVSHRTSGHGCPYCSGRRLRPGFNDFKSYCTRNNLNYLLKEWDDNNEQGPEEYAINSNVAVGWICPLGHKYNMQIVRRTQRLSQCPICNKERKTSFPEQAVFFYLSKVFSDAKSGDKDSIGVELDIYIPSIQTAVEYDGYDMHKNRVVQDKRKNEKCINNKIRLIRIREGELPHFDDCTCLDRKDFNKRESLNGTIQELFKLLGVRYDDIDIVRDTTAIYSRYVSTVKEDNFAFKYPAIAQEWNYIKNGGLSPNAFSQKSNKVVWWICGKKHEWRASINHRARGSGCPICSNRQIKTGENDMVTYCKRHHQKDVLYDWDKDKNDLLGIKINEVFAGSIIRVWWKCHVCGHEWINSINNRVNKNQMCPNCRKIKGIGQNRKKIQNIETGEVYNSIAEAAKSINVAAPSVSAVCRGIGKTAGGYHWKYIES